MHDDYHIYRESGIVPALGIVWEEEEEGEGGGRAGHRGNDPLKVVHAWV